MILKKIQFKNFFSSGNAFIEVDLLKYKKAVISAKNGMGKSTIFSAITFALFGKTIKPVTKAQIVNSINNKNCLVEIELEVDSHQYLIKRGIKPNVFEIYKDKVLVDQTSVLDYQDYLESHILKCSFRTFLQTSIISIENYKPFMTLTKGERRDFIEDILDIKIFTLMNQIIKGKITKNRDELKLIEVTLKSLKEKITLQKEHIDALESLQLNSIADIDIKLLQHKDNATKTILVHSTAIAEVSECQKRLVSIESQKKLRDSVLSKLNEVKTKIKSVEKDIVYYEEHPFCPTCNQSIDSTASKSYSVCTLTELNTQKEYFLTCLEQYDGIDEELSALFCQISELQSNINTYLFTINSENKAVTALEKEKEKVSKNIDVDSQKATLKEFVKEAKIILDKKTELNTEQDYNSVMLDLFKDSGIKSKIVDQYLPIINTLVNTYLDKLDFFVSFNLDSEFNEIIKSRHRDTFTYSSFSAGERQRIDMALMFTFRQLAKMKNSFSCNLLALDEITDSSLDATGIELLLEILSDKEFESSNILIISHANKEKFEDVFDGCYNVTKRDGFSEISDERL